MKKLLLLSLICILSQWVVAQTNITCQAYYMSSPNRNLPNVAVTARSATGTIIGSCNTGSGGSCVISGTSALLTASYQFTNGYEVNERLTNSDTIVRAAFDESYVRDSPTITREIEDAPSSSYPDGFIQTGNYVYFRAFTPGDGFQVRRHNVLTNTHETIALPFPITTGNVAQMWLAGSRILVYADRQFYIITNPTTLTPTMSSALAGVPLTPDARGALMMEGNYLYFSSYQGLTELEVSTSTFRAIDVAANAHAGNIIHDSGTNYIYFTASDNGLGGNQQLWRVFYGGYTATKISNINSPNGAEINEIVKWNGRMYFSAATPALGRELYRTNAAGDGVELFLDIVTGSTSSNVMRLTPAVSAALGQNELYAETHQLGLVRISTAGVVNQVVDATTGNDIRVDKMIYTPTRGILYCRNGSASKVYEHIYGNINATDLTASNNLELYGGYNGIEMLPWSNGIIFKGKKLSNNDTYLGQIFYIPFTFLGITTWTRFVTTIRTFPNTLLPSLFNQSKLANLTQVGSRVYFSAMGDASRGFEPWYYDSGAMPSTVETPQVNTQPLGITNSADLESVSYGNYFYYNAENISESGLRNNGLAIFQESIQKTLGTQNSENFSRLFVSPDITSLKMAGSRMFATSMGIFNTSIQSVDLANNASSVFPAPTADIRTLSNTSSIGNTLYFLSFPRAAGSMYRRLWRTDGTTAGTYTVDAQNTSITGTYAWNGGVFYAKDDGFVTGGFYRYDHASSTTTTISTTPIFVSNFIEFAGSLFYRAATGAVHGTLRRTDGITSSNVVVAPYTYDDVQILQVGNRIVVAVLALSPANWEIKSTTDGVNFVSHFSSGLPLDFRMMGGANGILLGTTTAANPTLTAYNLNTNTSTVLGTGSFNKINFFPVIDDTTPASAICYLAMAPTSTSGYYLYRTTLTTSGASSLTAIGASWVKVIDRSANRSQTLHRVGKKIFFLGQDADNSRGIEMWVYNPDRCTNALTLASYDEDRYNSEYNSEESNRDIHYVTNSTITATNKITNATVLYRAGQSITFLPGFKTEVTKAGEFWPAGTGAFEAQIGGCGTLVPR